MAESTARALLLFSVLCLSGSAAAARTPEFLAGNQQHVALMVDGAEESDNMGSRQHLGTGKLQKSSKGDSSNPTDPDDKGKDFCAGPLYRKQALKFVKELAFPGLFPELTKLEHHFEGSGITPVNGSYYVVFDSLASLGQFDLRFSFRGPENRMVRGPHGADEDSQFEGISYSERTNTFFVVQESVKDPVLGLVPLITEIRMNSDGSRYEIVGEAHPVNFKLDDENKGFESVTYFDGDGGERYILGMCEGNFCKGNKNRGDQRGNGKIVWAEYKANTSRWEVKQLINLPPDAYFADYSSIGFWGYKGEDVAIVTQEDAAVWVGKFDWKAMAFKADKGKTYHFPRSDNDCNKIFCNVEGIAWIDRQRLVVVSDKAKDDQDYRCMQHDQSVHIFALP